MFGKTFKIIAAFLFIPVVIAVTKAFLHSLENLDALNFNLYLLCGGFFAYPIFHIIFVKPMYIYTLGHEIVHVVATWLCGGKVTSFRVSQSGGKVTTTKTNLFIRLSPYFVPIHTIAVLLLFWSLSKFYNMSAFSREFVFLIGFTMSFHIFMTIEVIKVRQPDIIKTGYLLSVLLIYIANIFILDLVLSVIFKGISFLAFAKDTCVITKDIYIDVLSRLFG